MLLTGFIYADMAEFYVRKANHPIFDVRKME